MSDQFLVPCECGRTVAVTTSESGSVRRCVCGRKVEVPPLRELKQLPRAVPDAKVAAKNADNKWNDRKGILFAGGLLFVAAAAFGLFMQFKRSSEIDINELQREIRKWPVQRCYIEWSRFKNFGINSMSEAELRQKYDDVIALRWIHIAEAVMAIDVAIVAGLLLLRSSSGRKRRPPD